MSSIKIIRASQATHIHLYKNLKGKILNAVVIFISILNVVLDCCFIYNTIVNNNTTGCLLSKLTDFHNGSAVCSFETWYFQNSVQMLLNTVNKTRVSLTKHTEDLVADGEATTSKDLYENRWVV